MCSEVITPDQAEARRLTRERFAPRAARWDRNRSYCWANIADLVAAGFMGMTLPRSLGGRGASLAETCLVVEEIAKGCALTARVVVEANMGGLSAILAYGSESLKAFVAPIVLAGDKPAICITEPGAGSAATDMTTRARPVRGGFRLSGRKCWITGGGVSRLYLVLARLPGREPSKGRGIGAFLLHVDPDTGTSPAGFEVVRRERTMGLCGMPEAELGFDDVFVPAERALLPGRDVPKGFSDLMAAYNSQRIGAGTVALGLAAGAVERARDHLLSRQQFGRPLAEFQGLQWMLADMDMSVHAARLLLREAGRSAAPLPDPTLAARAKLFATEMAVKVVNDALQMFGARGYGGEEPLERMARDVRMFTIGGGTAQILRNQLAGALLGIRNDQRRPAAHLEAAE